MSADKGKVKVLFLCTGNSCRSQMAEGWAKRLKGECIEAFSAGTMPAGLSKKAAEVMAEAGVDISGQSSKHVDELEGIDFDYVVTLCDQARQQCALYGGRGQVVHRPFEDPSFVSGDPEAVLAAFRRTRDEIRDFIETLPESLERDGR